MSRYAGRVYRSTGREELDYPLLLRAIAKIEPHEQREIETQGMRLITGLKKARFENYGNEKTHFGDNSALELLAKLGIWMNRNDV